VTTITREPLADAMVCISCGVPATVRGLDKAHVQSRARRPDLKESPDNQVLMCRLCHDLMDREHKFRLVIEDGCCIRQEWSDETADFADISRLSVVVDKRRGHLVPVDGLSAGVEAGAASKQSPPAVLAPALSPLADCCQRLMILSYQFDRLESATDEWKWQVGECMNDLERIVGAEEVNGYLRGFRKEKTLMQYAWVAAKVTRVIGLSWSHHRAVAALPPSEQRELLEEAKATDTPAEGLRLALSTPGERHACPECGAEHQVKT